MPMSLCSNRTIMELKWKKLPVMPAGIPPFQSHHNGIEIAKTMSIPDWQRRFQSHHNGIEINMATNTHFNNGGVPIAP